MTALNERIFKNFDCVISHHNSIFALSKNSLELIQRKTNISQALLILVSLGMLLSLAHNHLVEFSVDNGIDVQIERNTNECIVCASHFKFSVDTEIHSSPLALHWETLDAETAPAVDSPVTSFHKNRAPPSVVIG